MKATLYYKGRDGMYRHGGTARLHGGDPIRTIQEAFKAFESQTGGQLTVGDRIVIGDGGPGVWEVGDFGTEKIASGPAGQGMASALEGP